MKALLPLLLATSIGCSSFCLHPVALYSSAPAPQPLDPAHLLSAPMAPTPPTQEQICEELANGHDDWNEVAASAAVLAGGGGLGTLGVSGTAWKTTISITSLVVGVFGAFSSTRAADKASRYSEEGCKPGVTK